MLYRGPFVCDELIYHCFSRSDDEFEALRLADYEGLYQEQAAERMGVSRQTFGRIVEAARRKVAEALVKGLALRIGGGQVEMIETGAFRCADCGHAWEVLSNTGRPERCPSCRSTSFQQTQAAEDGSAAGGGRCGRNRHGGQGGGGQGRGGGQAADRVQDETGE